MLMNKLFDVSRGLSVKIIYQLLFGAQSYIPALVKNLIFNEEIDWHQYGRQMMYIDPL